MTKVTNICSCGDSAPHVIAKRETADGIAVQIWHDGAITGRFGHSIPGVPVIRPRTARALELARIASSLIEGDIAMYDVAELPRLYECARRGAARGGSRRDLCAALAEADRPTLHLTWCVYATDSAGAPTVRVARLDRIRWPGLAVWHERGRYDLMAISYGTALGAQSREALVSTGFSFATQDALFHHLVNVQGSTVEATP